MQLSLSVFGGGPQHTVPTEVILSSLTSHRTLGANSRGTSTQKPASYLLNTHDPVYAGLPQHSV